MSIYSETMSNTPVDTTFEECEQVIILEDPFEIYRQTSLICNILQDKGYPIANIVFENGKELLEISHVGAAKFANNMRRLGYPCRVLPSHKRRYKWVEFRGYTPRELIHVYHFLDVIK